MKRERSPHRVKRRRSDKRRTNLRLPVLKLLLTRCVSAAPPGLRHTRRGEELRRGARRRSARRTGRLHGPDDLSVSGGGGGGAGGGQLFVQSGDSGAGDGDLTEPTTTR